MSAMSSANRARSSIYRWRNATSRSSRSPRARLGTPRWPAARSSGAAAGAVRALREALRQVDPDLAVEVIGGGRTVLSGASVFLRAAGVAALALGGVTLALAMVGLFGIQSHTVAHRTREI